MCFDRMASLIMFAKKVEFFCTIQFTTNETKSSIGEFINLLVKLFVFI